MKNNLLLIVKIAIFSFVLFSLKGFAGNEKQDKKIISGGEVTFTVRTVTQNGTYAPKHVLAIWVEDVDGFIKTRKAMANQRKEYLYTWKAASNYNVVDAITGSTLTTHQTHTVSWNCTDLDGNIVPDGEYTIWVEFTEKHAQGPLYNLTFTKGPNQQSISPADQTYFKDIQLDFIPLVADFSVNVANICQGESVIFTDLSVGAANWSWNFGSGASPASATTAGPHTVTYTSPGAKTVSLTINNTLTETKQNMITVQVAPTAEFSFDGSDNTVNFTNNSLNANSYLWDFGDGQTSSENDPVHTYSTAGAYSVSLTASYLNCTDLINHEVIVPLVGIHNFPHESEVITYYPNPSAGLINLKSNEWTSGTTYISVYNSLGTLVYFCPFNDLGKWQTIDLSVLSSGLYYIIAKNSGNENNQKILIHK